MSKRELRKAARSRLVDRAGADRIQAALLGEAGLDKAAIVALYAATEHEPPLDRVARVLADRGVTTLFPRVEGERLLLHAVSLRDLIVGYGGIPEPAAQLPEVDPAEVDVFVVPGVLFDRAGRRLGRGRGHYDRLLKSARSDSLTFGFAFDERIVDELPEEEWDVRMHWVVTPTQRIRGRR